MFAIIPLEPELFFFCSHNKTTDQSPARSLPLQQSYENHLSTRASTSSEQTPTDLKSVPVHTGPELVYTGPRLIPASRIDDDALEVSARRDVDRPSACRLARRLYCLDGFHRGDVYKHLCKKWVNVIECIYV